MMDRELIDAAVAAGRVNRIPMGMSGLYVEYKWNPKIHRLRPVEKRSTIRCRRDKPIRRVTAPNA